MTSSGIGNRPAKRRPQRLCVACRTPAEKQELIRIVRTENGVEVDPSGKQNGRGAYLHRRQDCWQIALERRLLQRALRTSIDPEALDRLQSFAASLHRLA